MNYKNKGRREFLKALQRSLSKVGISVRPASNVRPVDLSSYKDIHPIEAVYLASSKSALIKIPISKCVHMGFNGFSCTGEYVSPYVTTLLEFSKDKSLSYLDSSLYVFYEKFKPSCVAELIRLRNPSYDLFKRLSPSYAIYPWDNISPKQAHVNSIKGNYLQNLSRGESIPALEGDAHFGPVSTRKGQLEFSVLLQLYKSIKKNGLKIDTEGLDNISGVFLCNSEHDFDYTLMVTAGQHRLAALSALGYKDILVQVSPAASSMIRRSEVCFWPGVKNNYFTKNEALEFFDRIFLS